MELASRYRWAVIAKSHDRFAWETGTHVYFEIGFGISRTV